MGYVCAIAGGKGGVGKTTTAINLARVAAQTHDVALLDADLEMANVGAMLGHDPDNTLHDVLAGEASLADVFVDRDEGPALVVGDQHLDAYAEADPAALDTVVTDLRAGFDLVVIDTGAGLSHDGLVPLDLADGILLVTTPNGAALRDTEKTAALAERVDGSVIGAVVTRATPDTDVEQIADDFPYPLLRVVPEDPEVGTTAPIVKRSPDAPAATAYRRLADGLERVAFEGATGAELAETREATAVESTVREVEPVSGDGGPDASEEPDPTAADDDTDSSGVFGLFR